jgi:PAS domain S-box-containing protein
MQTQVYPSISFKQVYEHARDAAMLIMDKDGNILQASKGIERSFGYTEENLAGKNFSILFTREDLLKNKHITELYNCLHQGAASDKNYIVHKDGSYIWVHGETICTRDGEGNIRLVKIVYDINEQKVLETSLMNTNNELQVRKDEIERLNDELRGKVNELDKANKDLETFFYTASHDLKAPISNIEALIQAVKEQLGQKCFENVKDEMDFLIQSVEKFRGVINELAEAVKDKPTGKDQEKEIQLTEVIKEIKMSLHEQIESTKTVFVEDFGKAPAITILKKNLRSVLYNLISNAIKYRSPQRVPEVMLQSYRDNGYFVIKITDNGLGMNQKMKDQIFDKFKRFHSHVEGSGLGMNIVKRILDECGGKIEVDSEEGKGSEFRVYFKQ